MGRHVSGIPGIRSVAHAAPGAGLGELLRPGLVARGTDYAIGVMEVSGAFAFFCVTKRGG